MSTIEADTVIIGSGVAGVLVAQELARRGQQVTIVERGSLVPWKQSIQTYRYESDSPTARHNDEDAPNGERWELQYVYGVGGSCNHWTGQSPRFLPEDFEMRSRYGVMVDWPISYEELLPHYQGAERAMAIAGGHNDLMPGAGFPLPAPPLSPQDRSLAPYLHPFIALPQARPTRPVGERPACCGSARCDLCPVNARFSVLNGLGSVLEQPEVRLIKDTIAARLVKARTGRQVAELECINAGKERTTIVANRFVVAANAIESPALLLRSQIDTQATGRYFSTRRSTVMELRTRKPVGPGRGASRNTGGSYAYYRGDFRTRRVAALLSPVNFGASHAMSRSIIADIVAGTSANKLRKRAVASWERTIVVDVTLEDEPDPSNTVALSPKKDSFGIPLNRVRITGGSRAYEERAIDHLTQDLPKRLRPIGARDVSFTLKNEGAHLLGSLRMGRESEGVVDRDLRHHGFDNLFVVGGSVFPTYSASHPTLTIAALAVRLGRMLARES